MKNFTNIALLIRTRRLSHPKKLSQTELSAMLGYKNGQFISNIERSLCSVPMEMMETISTILNISQADMAEALVKDFNVTLANHYTQENVIKKESTLSEMETEDSTLVA